jgi:hypothetical protein
MSSHTPALKQNLAPKIVTACSQNDENAGKEAA